MTGPAPLPPTSHIGGGSSARLVALGVVGVLVAVVWIGFSNRPPAPPPVAVAAPTPTLAPTPTSGRTATPAPTVSAGPTPDVAPEPTAARVRFLVNGVIGTESFQTGLAEDFSGSLSGSYTVLDPPLDGGALAFEIMPPSDPDQLSRDSLGAWIVSLETLSSNKRAGLEGMRAEVDGRPTQREAPLIVRRGFDVHVSVSLAFDQVAVVDFQIHERQRDAIGDDGLAGCRAFGTCFPSQ